VPTTAVVRDQIAFDLFDGLFTKTVEAPPPPEPAVKPAPVLAHTWIVAAEIPVEERVAKLADFRGSFTLERGRVDALEVYCRSCRRPYEDVAETDCEAQIDNRHLIGGDQSVRAKRKIPTPPPGAKLISGGSIQRRGIGAYVTGVSRPR
jgi:hypothetical protein